MALLCILAIALSINLHEFIHLLTGRLAGLPAQYLDWTAVGVTPEVAASAPAGALALMNGVAPLATMLMGVLVLIVVPRASYRAPRWIADFLCWWAVFGVAYIGAQLMTTGYPAVLRGNGADLAAVIGGYWRAAPWVRATLSLAGLLMFMGCGFLLSKLVAPVSSIAEQFNEAPAVRRKSSGWRRVTGGLLGILLLGLIARGFMLTLRGDGRGVSVLYVAGSFVWPLLAAVMVPWSSGRTQYILRTWLVPAAVASGVFLLFGLLTHSDYATVGMVLLPPLVTASLASTL